MIIFFMIKKMRCYENNQYTIKNICFFFATIKTKIQEKKNREKYINRLL